MNIPFLFVLFVVVATVGIGMIATGRVKSAGDLFVAGRNVGVMLNAGAISGEYLSAASFMGIAGLVMKNGYDALWYPVGYAAGYLFLLLFIAGPLRRFGAYTIPDFAEGRFDSPAFRKIAVLFVLSIGLFYTMPQMKGAGVVMGTILGWPYWAGIAVVGTVITFNVALGGMKGITLVQAFQYWLKLFAISVPLFILASLLGVGKTTPDGLGLEGLREGTTFKIKGAEGAPNNVLVLPRSSAVRYRFPKGAELSGAPVTKGDDGGWRFDLVSAEPSGAAERPIMGAGGGPGTGSFPSGRGTPGSVPGGGFGGRPGDTQGMVFREGIKIVEGERIVRRIEVAPGQTFTVAPGETLHVPTAYVWKGGQNEVSGVKLTFVRATEAEVVAPYGRSVAMAAPPVPGAKVEGAPSPVPNAPENDKWLAPYGPASGKHGYPVLWTYSLIVALVCGTAGLPHILVRFYTNPDGRAAKRTTLWVMVLLGAFYVFTPFWGTLGRTAMPVLYASNTTDAVVIKLPTILQNETLGQILSGVTAAGAFAAFMSTFSGLLVSMSGAFAHDVYGRILRPGASDAARLRAFRLAAVGVGLASMGLGLLVETFDIATMVGWAFAIGAASYFPLLLLGAWWRGLTAIGAATGMLLGGFASLGAIVLSMLLDKGIVPAVFPPLVRALLEQPAIWGVPLSLATMGLVSAATRSRIPADVDEKMIRLHAPEELGYGRNYIEDGGPAH